MAKHAPGGIQLDRVVTFKCDSDWLAALDETARRCGVTRSEAIRRAVSGLEVVEAADVNYRDMVFQLMKLGTLYNQTVKLAHQSKYRTGTIPTDELSRQLEAHDVTFQRLLQAVLAQDPRRGGPGG